MSRIIKKKIAIGVVTYHPSASLAERLRKAIDSGFEIYLFDNSPEQDLIRKFAQEFSFDVVKYLTVGKNVGLGFGISSVCAQAYYDSHKALVFFDQDTVFDLSALSFIEDFYVQKPEMAKSHSAVVFNAKTINEATPANKFNYKDVVFIISSGSLFYLENLKKINWHNEKYFVDCVDYEFCLRSNNAHFLIGECSMTPGFDHQSEQPDAKYKVFGKERMLRKYSPSRVWDAVTASLRLFRTSIGTGNLRYSVAILRSLAGYCFWQLLVRLINIFKPRDGKIT